MNSLQTPHQIEYTNLPRAAAMQLHVHPAFFAAGFFFVVDLRFFGFLKKKQSKGKRDSIFMTNKETY